MMKRWGVLYDQKFRWRVLEKLLRIVGLWTFLLRGQNSGGLEANEPI